MKIIEALNSIISNPNKITDVYQNDKEFFFLYDDKYKWSITLNPDGHYVAFLYPKNDKTIEELASMDSLGFVTYKNFITFKSEEIKTREATETFAELYRLVSNRLFGVDEILDDIINS